MDLPKNFILHPFQVWPFPFSQKRKNSLHPSEQVQEAHLSVSGGPMITHHIKKHLCVCARIKEYSMEKKSIMSLFHIPVADQ